MEQYQALIRHVLDTGVDRMDRTGVGTRSIFGHQMRFKLSDGFPVVTCKKTNLKAVVNEFLWMVVEGSTDVRWLQERGHSFWNEWQKDDGTIGPGYGHQMRKANGIDQVQNVIDSLRTNPDSRRHIISLWNPSDTPEMALPPCHSVLIQFYSVKKGMNRFLSCQTYSRSQDLCLGTPWNLSFSALLTCVVARLTNHVPEEMIYTIGDAHIYHNHIDTIREVVNLPVYPLPTLWLGPRIGDINTIEFGDIKILGYESGPVVKLRVAV